MGVAVLTKAPVFSPVSRTVSCSSSPVVGLVIVTWNVFRHAGVLRETGSLSETMKVIVYPWVYPVSLGCAGLTLALILDFLKSCIRVFRGSASQG